MFAGSPYVVVTGGGIIGKVSKVLNDTEVQVEISEGVKVRVQRATISAVLQKTEAPADDGGAANDDEGESEKKDG